MPHIKSSGSANMIQKYPGKSRRKVIWLLLAIGAVALIWANLPKFHANPPPPPTALTPPPPAKPPFMPTSYKKRFCETNSENNKPIDLSEDDTLGFDVTLENVDCFVGPIKASKYWRRSHTDISPGSDNWAAVWCEGQAEPGRPHPFFEPFTDDDFPTPCQTFYLEGKGTVHFTRTVRW